MQMTNSKKTVAELIAYQRRQVDEYVEDGFPNRADMCKQTADRLAAQEKEIERLRKALGYYADPDEWSGHPWKLLFNSGHADGDGYETAKKALQPQEDK